MFPLSAVHHSVLGTAHNWRFLFFVCSSIPSIHCLLTYLSRLGCSPFSPAMIYKKYCTTRLTLAVIAAAVGGSLLQGYNITSMNAPSKHIIDWTLHLIEDRPLNCIIGSNSTNAQQDPCKSGRGTHAGDDLYYTFLVSIYLFGGMFGSFMSGTLGDIFGRKWAILYNSGFAYIGTTMLVISYYIGEAGYWTFLFGRLIIGFNAGLNSGLVPTYLIEISPRAMRGAITVIFRLFFTVGLFLGTFIGIFLGECGKWSAIFIFPYLPISICIGILPFCPESPRFFMKIKKLEDKAEVTLRALRPLNHDVDEEMSTLRDDTAREEQVSVTLRQIFNRPYRWPLILCISMMAAQQFAGVNAVNYYSTNIFKKDAGLNDEESKYATCGLMLVNVTCGTFAIWLVDRPWVGRRFLIIVGLAGCCFVMLLLFILLKLLDCNNKGFPRSPTNYIAIGLLVVFMMFYNIGPSPVNMVVISESFHSHARPKASAIVACANWFFNFSVSLVFNPLRKVVGVYVFLLFVGVGGLLVLFLFLFLAETKGKTVEQLNEEWKAGFVAFNTEIRHRDADSVAETSGGDSQAMTETLRI